jgi:anti-sigma factor RsiW
MSSRLSRESALDLMAFADGELDDSRRRAVEELLEQDAAARVLVRQMRAPHVRTWLEAAIENRAEEAGVDRIADEVMRRLPAETPAVGRIPLAMRAGRARVAARVAAVCCGALAAAAAFLLTTRLGVRSPAREAAAPVMQTGPLRMASRPAAVESHPTAGVEVDEIDSPSHAVSVFELGAGEVVAANVDAPPSVVIWIEDEQEDR